MLSCERADKDGNINLANLCKNVFRMPSEYEESRDGLNNTLRLLRPRNPHARIDDNDAEFPNRFQSMLAAEAIVLAMSRAEVSNGGKLKASKVFKKLLVSQTKCL